MRIRKIAVLIDGGFYLKRLKKWPAIDRDDPRAVAEAATGLCRRHVQKLTRESFSTRSSAWLDHVYRLFYYDARPYKGSPHHPLKNRQVHFATTTAAKFRTDLFHQIRNQRKFALRLGTLKGDGDWAPHDRHMKKLLKMWHHREYLSELVADPSKHDPEKIASVSKDLEAWKGLGEDDVHLPLRQKGVDMRIGLDIASMALKNQVDTIILVTGDSDFIPAAKIARREGVEFILDPLWQSIEPELMEHVDGLSSGFARPTPGSNPVEEAEGPDQGG